MLKALWKKYDKWTIISFFTVGLIFGLNGSVQTSILLLFYEPQTHCPSANIGNPGLSHIQHQHQTNLISSQHGQQMSQPLNQLESSQFIKDNNKNDYFSGEFEQSSIPQEFKWLCGAGETEKLITQSSMGAGIFLGFLVSFFAGRDYSNSHRAVGSERTVYLILACIGIQTISLLTTPLFATWYHAAILLFLQSATQAFLYSSIYKFIALKYGTVLQKYSSVIYQGIWTISTIIFLLFARLFSGWRAILFYYQGMSQAILLIVLIVSLQFAKKKEIEQVKSLKSIHLTHNNELDPTTYVTGIRAAGVDYEEEDENSSETSSGNHHTVSISPIEKTLSKMEKSLSHHRHAAPGDENKTSFMLSRFQTEDYLLTIQVNYSQNDSDTFGGNNYTNRHGDQLNQTNLPDMNVMFENQSKYFTEESLKKANGSQRRLSMNQAVVENLKQKYTLDAVNLREQQDQIIHNSDLNLPLDQFTNNIYNNISNHNNNNNNMNIQSNSNTINSGTNIANFNSFSNNLIQNNNYNNQMPFQTLENEPQKQMQNTLERLESSGSRKTLRLASQPHSTKVDDEQMRYSSPSSRHSRLRRNSTKPTNNNNMNTQNQYQQDTNNYNNTQNQYQQDEDLFFSAKNAPSVTNPRQLTNASSSSQIPMKILMPYQLPSMHQISQQQQQQQSSQFNIQAQQAQLSNNNNTNNISNINQTTQFNMTQSQVYFNNAQFQQSSPNNHTQTQFNIKQLSGFAIDEQQQQQQIPPQPQQFSQQMQQLQLMGLHSNQANNNNTILYNSLHNQSTILSQNNNNNNNNQQLLTSKKLSVDQNLTLNQINTMQTIRTEMRTRWMQLKRDPDQKNNIATFICCWIVGNGVNYGIYFALLAVPGDIYAKLTLCAVIEMVSNYIASFALIRFNLKCVILLLFLIAGSICCATFWMENKSLLAPLLLTKLCLELFFPVKTYFLQFVIHSQYFSVSVGLADTLAGLFQALIPVLVGSFNIDYHLFGYFGIGILICFLLLTNVQMTNIIGLNAQFSLYDKSPAQDTTNLQKLADILEVDSAADHTLYSSVRTLKSIGNQH